MGITLNPGSGGNVLNTDLVSGLDTQIVKIGVGAAGTAPVIVSPANPLPVMGQVSVSAIGSPVAVSGSVNIAGTATVAGAVSSAIQDGHGSALTSLALGSQQALSVAIVDAAGNQISTFGGTGGTSQTDASAFTRGTSKENPIGALVETSPPTLVPGTLGAMSLDVNGNLRVTVVSGGAASGTAGSPSPDVISVQGLPGMTPIQSTVVPGLAPGSTLSRIVAQATINASVMKGAPGVVLGYALYNNTNANRYFRFYNKATTPSPSSDTPAFTVIVPAGGGANVSYGDAGGIPFGTGIAYDLTAGVADNDTTVPAANDVHGFVIWK